MVKIDKTKSVLLVMNSSNRLGFCIFKMTEIRELLSYGLWSTTSEDTGGTVPSKFGVFNQTECWFGGTSEWFADHWSWNYMNVCYLRRLELELVGWDNIQRYSQLRFVTTRTLWSFLFLLTGLTNLCSNNWRLVFSSMHQHWVWIIMYILIYSLFIYFS